MSDNVENNVTPTEEKVPDIATNNEDVPLEKEPKQKKPRTEKQMEAFKLTQQRRAKNIAKKREEKLAGKTAPVQPKEEVQAPPARTKETITTSQKEVLANEKRKKSMTVLEEASSDSEEEIIVRKKMKPKKKIIVELTDSEDSDHEPTKKQSQPKEPAKESAKEPVKEKEQSKADRFDSQQNKKYKNYFCD
jgi:hypothetical protein